MCLEVERDLIAAFPYTSNHHAATLPGGRAHAAEHTNAMLFIFSPIIGIEDKL
jgi:hypothetical protein